MKCLEEANRLIEKDSPYSLSNYQKLLELREQARGEEATRVGELIERFLLNCPLEVMKEIIIMDK